MRNITSPTIETDTDDTQAETLLDTLASTMKQASALGKTISETVQELSDMGLDRDDIVSGLCERGINPLTASQTVSRCLCPVGKRVKAKGQGRKLKVDPAVKPFVAALVKERFNGDLALAVAFLADAHKWAKRSAKSL